MKTSIYARVVAKSIAFPEQIEIQFQPVDELGNGLGFHYKDDRLYRWNDVMRKFLIGAAYAIECEGFFEQGSAALIARPQVFEGQWPEPGDPEWIHRTRE